MRRFTLSIAVLVTVLSALLTAPASAQSPTGVEAAVMAEGGKLVRKTVMNALRSITSEHERFYPDGRVAIIPLWDLGGSRVSFNFNHRSWVPRGSRDRRVRITFHGIPRHLLPYVRVVMKADKPGRKDRNRSGMLAHGSVFRMGYGTSGDRAYYFVERGQFSGRLVPPGAYVKLELLD